MIRDASTGGADQDRATFGGMIHPLRSAIAALLLVPAVLAAQLPMITVPSGLLRIDVNGAFYPSNDFRDNGRTRPLGSMLDGTDNGMVSSLQRSLSQIAGESVTGLSLGGISAVAAREHGVGEIGLALGATRRITVFGTIPIVYVRNRVTLAFDSSTSRVGINPANTILGTSAGQQQATNFFTQFDAALASLSTKIQDGDYASDPATLTLAQQTLTRASSLRGSLFSLLSDPIHASAVLPVSGDPAATQLLGAITTLESTLSNQLGVADLNTVPALPSATLTSGDLGSVLGSQGGFGFSTLNSLPHYGIGDVTAGVAVQLVDRSAHSNASHQAAWIRVAARFPTGTVADESVLLAQPTGSKSPAGMVDGIVELGARHLGLRATATYQHELAANYVERVTAPDAPLVPASFLAAVTVRPGDSMAITAQPFFRFAPHLAFAGVVQFWRRGGSSSSYFSGQAPIPGVSASVLDMGSSANALVIGVGLAYSHDGVGRDGHVGSPVEAGWSIERTIASGTGILPVALTSRVYLRIYRPLLKR
jgi:hypothetical protein